MGLRTLNSKKLKKKQNTCNEGYKMKEDICKKCKGYNKIFKRVCKDANRKYKDVNEKYKECTKKWKHSSKHIKRTKQERNKLIKRTKQGYSKRIKQIKPKSKKDMKNYLNNKRLSKPILIC